MLQIYGLCQLFYTYFFPMREFYCIKPLCIYVTVKFLIVVFIKLENTRNTERVVSHLDVLGEMNYDGKYRSIL